jgi:hypothetical protein
MGALAERKRVRELLTQSRELLRQMEVEEMIEETDIRFAVPGAA